MSRPPTITGPRGPRRFALLLAALVVLTLCCAVASLAWGSVAIPPDEVLRILGGARDVDPAARTIVLQFRLPRCLTALLAGAALALSGLQMQALFRNPLAGPYVLGISAGAGLGVAVVLLGGALVGGALDAAGIGLSLGITGAAIVGAAGLMLVVLLVSRHLRDNVSLLILGLMFGYAASALVNVLMHYAEAFSIRRFMLWSFGSFGGVAPDQLPVLALLVALGTGLGLAHVKSMNALLLGDAYAASLGVNMGRVRTGIILSASLLAGTVTAYCGPVAFLGVAVPHLCRGLLGTADQRLLAPCVMLLGASLATTADLLAQAPGGGGALPLNSVTAFIGAPVVIWVVLKRRTLRAT